jgi:hypothetical protein
MGLRFVQPEIVRLPLSGGEWIDVKKELNAGEQRRSFARMVKHFTAGEKAELNAEEVGRARVLEFIVGWSLVDGAGRPVPFSESALDNLAQESWTEISKAIEQHEEREEARRVAERDDPFIASGLSATSSSRG